MSEQICRSIAHAAEFWDEIAPFTRGQAERGAGRVLPVHHGDYASVPELAT